LYLSYAQRLTAYQQPEGWCHLGALRILR